MDIFIKLAHMNKARFRQKGLNQTVNIPKTHALTPFQAAPESYVKRWVIAKKSNYSGSIYSNKDTTLITELFQNKAAVSYKTNF